MANDKFGPNGPWIGDQQGLTNASHSNMSDFQDYLLPGQPVHIDPSVIPQLGNGLYTRGGDVRASLFGTPQLNHAVRLLLLLPSSPMRSEVPWLDIIH